MNERICKSIVAALTISIGMLGATAAHAEQKIAVSGAPYCAWETWVMSQVGNDIQVTAYSWGQGYNNGACNGAPAPENSIAMDAILAYKDPNTQQIKSCKRLTPNDNWLGGVYNTTDGLGIYFATIPGGGLLSSGAAGAIIPTNELCGAGYYQVEMDTCVQLNGSPYWTCGPVSTPWEYMNIPNP